MVRFSRPIYEPENKYWYVHLFDGDRDVAELVWETHGTMWHVVNLQVGRPYQRKGYGRMMVRHLEQMAKQKGVKTLHLYALWDAAPFWAKIGYDRNHNEDEAGSYGMDKRLDVR